MDFSNERYVRLYTRNSTTWRRLGWEGQCMLMQLLRVTDRSGVLEIQDMTPVEAAVMHTGMPEEVSDIGVTALMKQGVVEHRDGLLLFPKFLEAQEVATSDAERKRQSRERRRDDAQAKTPKESPPESQNVTECHVRSQTVTTSHDRSRSVTPAVPAVPCLASPSVPASPASSVEPQLMTVEAFGHMAIIAQERMGRPKRLLEADVEARMEVKRANLAAARANLAAKKAAVG